VRVISSSLEEAKKMDSSLQHCSPLKRCKLNTLKSVTKDAEVGMSLSGAIINHNK